MTTRYFVNVLIHRSTGCIVLRGEPVACHSSMLNRTYASHPELAGVNSFEYLQEWLTTGPLRVRLHSHSLLSSDSARVLKGDVKPEIDCHFKTIVPYIVKS
jgi:hypothetical protein